MRMIRRLIAITLLAGPLWALRAQNLLYTEYNGRMVLVRAARRDRPVVEIDGKRVVADGSRFVLNPVADYLPVFISIRNVAVSSTYAMVEGSGARVNNELHFAARFESTRLLEDVFAVFDLRGDVGGRMLFIYEIGRMNPRQTRPISITVPMSFPLGNGVYHLHLFAGGPEVLHSQIPVADREAALDRLIAKRVAGVKDRALSLFVGAPPVYPEALRKRAVKGQATIAVLVSVTGRPLNPAVLSASDPAFGEAALDSVRLWRFLPPVKDGQPHEQRTNLPFVFLPPGPGEK